MEAIDAFFGQNWVDQAQREHPIHPNRGIFMREYRTMPPAIVVQREKWAVITCLMTWAETEQGHLVWGRRHNDFLDRTQDLLR